MYDVAVIGAGVIGSAVTRELMKFDGKVVLLEKNNDVSTGSSKANSGIVHAGYDAPSYSVKGKFNKAGNDIYGKVCHELNVPFKRIGSLVVAFNEENLETLEALKLNGEKLGIKGLEIIKSDELLKMEPNLNKKAIAALHAPSAGITEPWELTIAYCENAMDNGAELKLTYEVESIEVIKGGFLIKSSLGEIIKTKFIVNASGVYADEVYKMINKNAEFEIHPRRGQYYLLDKNTFSTVNKIIFDCPTKLGKGVLVLPTADGNLLVGPDSQDLDFSQKESVNTTAVQLKFIKEKANEMIDNIPFHENITTFSGIRAEPTGGDFIIGESVIKGFYNIAGMKSPGLSSAPAIGKYVAKEIKMLLNLGNNEKFNALRKERIRFNELTVNEKKKIIEKDKSYGRIICRCESITEGEIIDSIHRNCGARTANGIKRRVRPGAGRCQGGFCGPRIIEILSRELKIKKTDVLLENSGSQILIGETKISEVD